MCDRWVFAASRLMRRRTVTELIGEGFTLPAVQRILALQAEVEELRRQLARRRGDA
jgi:hypothetical protein